MRKPYRALFPLLATLTCWSALWAQTSNQSNTPAKPAVPGRDLTGVWNSLPGALDFSSFAKGDPPMTAWGQQRFDAAKPSQGPRGLTLKETNDMVYKCFPPGMPYIYLQVFPIQIVQTPKEVIVLFESDHFVQHIFIDGRKHPDDLTPTYMGHSIGHWEGDTLVVDVVGLKDNLWLDRLGHPESDQMHITQRFHRTDDKTMQIDFTFDDPKAYPKPWNSLLRFRLHPDWDIMEDICMDNVSFENFEK
jgi:hypothetical protein